MNVEQQIESTAKEVVRQASRHRRRRSAEALEEPSRRRRLDSPLLAAALGLVLVTLTALNLSGRGLASRPSEPSELELRQFVEEELEMLGLEIEAIVEETGELPVAIDDLVPPGVEAYGYDRLEPNRYRLTLTVDGRTASAELQIG